MAESTKNVVLQLISTKFMPIVLQELAICIQWSYNKDR